MTLLILGVALWSAAHLFKRLAPGPRAKLGEKGQGLVAVALVISVVLMVIGYRAADGAVYWGRDPMWVGINNILMVLAFYVFAASAAKDDKIWLGTKLRHPQLTAVINWAVAHLLVNGDVASIVLFGWIGVWALVQMQLINRAEPDYTPWQGASVAGDVRLGLVTLVVFSVIAGIHVWLGYNPFGG